MAAASRSDLSFWEGKVREEAVGDDDQVVELHEAGELAPRVDSAADHQPSELDHPGSDPKSVPEDSLRPWCGRGMDRGDVQHHPASELERELEAEELGGGDVTEGLAGRHPHGVGAAPLPDGRGRRRCLDAAVGAHDVRVTEPTGSDAMTTRGRPVERVRQERRRQRCTRDHADSVQVRSASGARLSTGRWSQFGPLRQKDERPEL
jgi:hypothetical protein